MILMAHSINHIKTIRREKNEMQKKGIKLPIYSVPSEDLGIQKLYKILEYLAQKI